jgi:hypothetical protein
MLQIVASLTDDPSSIIYDQNIFIIQATDQIKKNDVIIKITYGYSLSTVFKKYIKTKTSVVNWLKNT